MGKRIDLAGRRFGNVVVIEYGGTLAGRIATWKCQCDCGNQFIARAGNLLSGGTQSCGCSGLRLTKERRAEAAKKHGHSSGGLRSPTYHSWQAMKDRCRRRDQWHWPKYGGRGIKVCPQWDESFEQFLKDMGDRPPRMSLDRINNDGDYEPGNCRWADAKTGLINAGEFQHDR